MRVVNKRKIASARKYQFYSRVILVLLVLLFLFISLRGDAQGCNNQVIYTDNTKLCALVADDNYERTVGLSGTVTLGNNRAMLFIFDDTDKHGIWMKDMLIPIDILWLNENKQIVWIEKNVTPESYPKIYYPQSPSKYVIEVSAGLSDKLNLTDNYQFSW